MPAITTQPQTQTVTFLTFVSRLGITLSPAQRVLCGVAYDGWEPRDLTGEDRELARVLFGPVEVIPPLARSVITHVVGRRGGKSHILLGLRVLHLALTVPVQVGGSGPNRIAEGESPYALIVARDLELAAQTLTFVRGAAEASPHIKHRISKRGKRGFSLDRGNGLEVNVKILAATAGGAAVRGRSYVVAALDEFAFFRDANYAVNDSDVFDAVLPGIVAGGQILIGSTPWARSGLLFQLYDENWGKPEISLVSHSTTVLLNPSKAAEVAKVRALNPDKARREHDAEFLDSSATNYFSSLAIDGCVDGNVSLPLAPKDFPGSEVVIGADTGMRSDSSAIVVVYKLADGSFIVADLLELKPKEGSPLKPSEVCFKFAEVMRRHGCETLMGDGHYQDTVIEELAKYRLSFVRCKSGNEAKANRYVHARNLIHSKQLKLPKLPKDPATRLVQQLKDEVAIPLSGGGMSFHSPRKGMGGHGDIMAALILALAQKQGERVAPSIDTPESGEESIRKATRAHWAKYAKEREERLQQEQLDAYGLTFGSFDGPYNEW